jgi:WhiB family redox-sensing transcriptional regulator
MDQNWRAAGLCGAENADLWFAVGAVEHRNAKRICARCPVRGECLAYAMDGGIDYGIWGGLTERERRRFRREAPFGNWREAVAEPLAV